MVKTIGKILGAGALAFGFATAMVATQAANPAQPGTSANELGTSLPAAAYGGDNHFHRGWYHNGGRYWHHRRWQAAYYGPHHHYHPGIWVYF